ncbi:MAG: S26 family signal peptidase, partial [Alistipes sp.]|nr:S26 family signal peptidase [Alistipes sp.]
MEKLRKILRNKWVGFGLTATLYVLWFVVWTGNLWLLLGLPLIYDFYISRLFYRHVWSRNTRLCERSKLYKTAYEWVNAVVFATIVATLVHLFVFQMYVIPTSSMERSLLVGDYLYVSKVTYGPQMPNTPLSFPFVHHTMPFSQTKKSFSEAIRWDYHRLKGLRKIARNDVVVFNFPAGDTVLLENQAVTYYDVLRSYEASFGKEEGRRKLNDAYTVIS